LVHFCGRWRPQNSAWLIGQYDGFVTGLADLKVVARSKFKLKLKQEVAVKSLLDGKDVLAVLPTGYGKSLVYQMFVALNFLLCPTAKIDFQMTLFLLQK